MRPKVSVCITTYNHEHFIERCVQSVLDQQTNFEIEILIGEDESTDGTRAIVKTLAGKYPDIIRPFFHSREDVFYFNGHPTGQNNTINNYRNVKGDYVAILDGDDYWTDTGKLQMQVDFLEVEREFAGCFHNSIQINDKGNTINDRYFNADKDTFDQWDAFSELKSGYHTSGLVFKAEVIHDMPDWFLKRTADYALDILITEYGKLKFFDKNMSAYRIHEGGVWSGKKMAVNYIETSLRLRIIYGVPKFREKYGDFLRSEIHMFMREAAWLYHKDGDRKNGRRAYWNYLKFKRPMALREVFIYLRKFLFSS